MGRSSHLLIFGAIVAVGAVTVYAWSSDAFGGEPAAGASLDRIVPAAGSGGDGALRAERNAVQPPRMQPTPQRDPPAEAAREEAARARGGELEDPAAAGDREARELASRSDAKLAGERVDPEWSHMMNERIGAFFARPSLGSAKLEAVDCRTTMCRLELSHRSVEDRKRFIQSFSDLAGATGIVFAHIESPGDLDIVVYVTRDGVELP